jgi:hypothetical protein
MFLAGKIGDDSIGLDMLSPSSLLLVSRLNVRLLFTKHGLDLGAPRELKNKTKNYNMKFSNLFQTKLKLQIYSYIVSYFKTSNFSLRKQIFLIKLYKIIVCFMFGLKLCIKHVSESCFCLFISIILFTLSQVHAR